MSHPVVAQLQAVLSPEHIATDPAATEHYRSGWRSGQGKALAVVFPQTLVALWRVLEVCVNNNCIIIMQAAKTGLTEGSTPSGDDYDREIVVINTLAMDDLIMLEDGKQVISFPGATLHKLEDQLKPFFTQPPFRNRFILPGRIHCRRCSKQLWRRTNQTRPCLHPICLVCAG